MQLSLSSTESIEAQKPPEKPSGIMMVNLISSFLGDCAQTTMPTFTIDSTSKSPSFEDSSKEFFESDEEDIPQQLMADT